MNIPEGWKLVPVEPTREMLEAQWVRLGDDWSPQERWEAMLAAAPTPPERSVRTDCSVVCLASQSDGITCPADSCDIEDGVRSTTPPAQDEPVAYRWMESKFDCWRYDEKPDPHRQCEPLYTRPDNSELRQVAEEVCKYDRDIVYLEPLFKAMDNLRAALEGK